MELPSSPPNPWLEADPEMSNRANAHQPNLAPEETSDDSSQVLSAEKGALRTWAAAGLLWTQQLQEVTRVMLTAGQALL